MLGEGDREEWLGRGGESVTFEVKGITAEVVDEAGTSYNVSDGEDFNSLEISRICSPGSM